MASFFHQMPSVSILINVRNGMPYLRDTLASIAAQTFTDYEVLVWLMESNDGTEEELAAWIPRRLAGQVFKSGLIPLGRARAELVKKSGSEFCAVVDADDISHPDRLERQVDFLHSHPEIALVGSNLRLIDEKNHPTGATIEYPVNHDDIVNCLLVHNSIGQPSVLFRREAILAVGNYSGGAVTGLEDYDLWLRLARQYKLANLSEYLVDYRFHPQSLTRLHEKAKQLERHLRETFSQHAPSLFGLTSVDADRVADKGHPLTLWCAWKAARHLARTQGGSIWRYLRKHSLAAAFLARTRRRDVISRVGLAFLDSEKGSVLRMIQEFDQDSRELLKRLLRKFSVGSYCVDSFRSIKARRRFQSWLRTQKQQGSILQEPIYFTGVPDGFNCIKAKALLWVESGVTFWISNDEGARPELHIGERVAINRHTYIGVYQPISIGDNTIIGAYSYIISANHRFESREIPIRDQGYLGAPIIIGLDVWIGTHVVILPGVTVGDGAIVGAGSIVTRSIPPYEIWSGVPARFVKKRP